MTTNQAKKKFLTIEKEFYSFAVDRKVKKTYRMYTKDFMPPTINYTIDHLNCEQAPEIQKTLGLKQKPVPQEIKQRFAENIKIQEQIMDLVIRRDRDYNYRCGLIKLTTGKGKSHIIMDIAEYYQTNTIILVHNIKTLEEMIDKFDKFTNIKPAQYGGGKKEMGKITVCTKRSFCNDYDKFADCDFGLFLIDEAPVQFSKKLWDAINIYCNNKKGIALYGLSGTPYKDTLEQSDLERYFGHVIEIKGQKNNGYNIIPNFLMYDYKTLGFYEYENPAELRSALADDKDRLYSQVEEMKKLIKDRTCLLVLSDRVQEVEQIEAQLQGDDIFVFTIKGNTKKSEDEIEQKNLNKASEMIEKGKQVIIVGTIQKMAIGVDIPYIDTVMLASAIKFKATVIQAIGRGLRKHKGKTDVIVGVWNDLPILRNQKNEKIKAITSEYGIQKSDIIHVDLSTKDLF